MTEPFHGALARTLRDHGVDTIFGLAGDANLFMLNSFVNEQGGTFVRSAHEAGAVLMAYGYASLSGRLGVATVTHGPALTNTFTALVEGVRSRVPLLLIAGDTAVGDRYHIQSIDQRDVIVPTGAAFEQVRGVESLVNDTTLAIRRALAESRPVVLNVPIDMQFAEVEYRPAPLQVTGAQAVAPDRAALEEAAAVIAAARRPVVVAGAGVVASGAAGAVAKLAERIGAPLATTLKAKDLFDGAAFNIGVFGTMSSGAGVEAIAEADCVVALGASLNKWTTVSGELLAKKRVVHCDIDRAQIGWYSKVDAAVVGDARAVAEALVDLMDEAEIPPASFRSERLQAMIDGFDPAGFKDRSGPDAVDVRTALLALEDALPRDRVLVSDGGQYVWDAWKMLHVHAPRSFLYTVNFGSIGLGMGSAIGASFAHPGRPVALITGDGGFMLGGLTEFNTAVRHGVDLVAIVFNNHCYGPEYVHLEQHNLDPALSLFDWPDFAPVAEALGGEGFTVRSRDDLGQLRARIENRTKPLLIDVKLDPALVATEAERA